MPKLARCMDVIVRTQHSLTKKKKKKGENFQNFLCDEYSIYDDVTGYRDDVIGNISSIRGSVIISPYPFEHWPRLTFRVYEQQRAECGMPLILEYLFANPKFP